jgi:DNA-binding transcriptional MerR regulator
VLALLLEEFPDVTISKIRFLESQGLIDPERTASGYRKFYADDVELLRCILREQRENFLPLKVIKDRIESGEIDPTNEHPRPRGIKNVSDTADVPRPEQHPSAGGVRSSADADGPVTGAAALFQRTDGVATPPSTSAPAADADADAPASSPAAHAPPAAPATAASPSTSTAGRAAGPGAVLPGLLLSADELCAMAGLSRDQLADLQTYGVVVGTSSKGDAPFDEDAVEIATISKRFLDAGIEARHLRGWRVAADREVALLDQLIQPLLRQRNPEARAQAVAELTELEEVGGRLRAAMVRSSVRHHGAH